MKKNEKLDEFARKVQRAMMRELGGGFQVEVKEVRKNNGVMLHGLLVLGREENVIPTIYLDSFYAAYEEGTTFGEVLRRILDIYRNETPKVNVDMEFFKSFPRVRDRICYRLIRRQDNEELLSEIPYVDFLDLAICFYYAYSGSALGEGTILIHNSHMELWGVKIKNLMELADQNTPRLFPGKLCSMAEVLGELFDTEEAVRLEREVPMTVLTNDRRTHGASCILYPGMLESFAGRVGKSFFIIPSSIHEVILLEKTGMESVEELKNMIYEINRTHVAAEEVLSDTLYYYDFTAKTVRVIS